MAAKEYPGRRFGKLLVLGINPDRRTHSMCKCDCGRDYSGRTSAIVAGRVVSCGCHRKARAAAQRNETVEDIRAWCRIGGADECWPWIGSLGNHGYGRIAFRGVEMTAHRAMYIAVHGPVQKGMVVCHKCDNPPCVNPAHLFLGTYKDNVIDMIAKGRGHWQSAISTEKQK